MYQVRCPRADVPGPMYLVRCPRSDVSHVKVCTLEDQSSSEEVAFSRAGENRNTAGSVQVLKVLSVCLRAGGLPATVHPILPSAAGRRGEAAQGVSPGPAGSGRGPGRTPGADPGGRGPALRSGP